MTRSSLERFLEDCLVREARVHRWPNVSREKREWAQKEARYLAVMLEEREVSGALKEARDCIGELLCRIDDGAREGPNMHWQGQTPDWYVKAALICCGLPTQPTEGDQL